MLEFIRLLTQRYQTIYSGLLLDDSLRLLFQERINNLKLGEAFIKKGILIEKNPEHPLQIAVIGPTQVGKSSVVNLLLNNQVAGVSPLAGYTVHPQGFSIALQETDQQWLVEYFANFKQVLQSELDANDHHCYSLTPLESETMPPCIIWDTADFDSIDAIEYREGVLKTIALADVLVLVLSKEKYADQSVWEIMNLIEPLNQPTIIILNKLVENTQSLVVRSLKEKWQEARNDTMPDVASLLYQKQGKPVFSPENTQLISRLLQKQNRSKQTSAQRMFLNTHWSAWIEPVIAEAKAVDEWCEIVEQCVNNAVKNYRRDYLDHPNHYETFQNAIVQLLTLLEVPGMAGVLAKTRKVLTWPARKILGIGKKNNQLADKSHEVVLLNQIAEHMLIQLADKLLDKIDQEQESSQWWKEINVLLRQQRPIVMQRFRGSVKQYHGEFQHDIDATAQRLYGSLQDQPILLNSLRITRVSTDAAAVALALHTGGIGLHDLIITPAMLSMTSLLAESAIGGYMHRQEVELKQHQLTTVKQDLFIAVLQETLKHLPELMVSSGHFNISHSQLEQAEQQLKDKPHGLRLF